jgi:glutamine amidotransferase
MKIAIIRYNAGNIRSVAFALERLGAQPILTDQAEEIASADKIIFPGVGQARTTMQYLQERKLDEVIRNLRQPVLGICLGMQLLCRHSEEGNTPCLGIFDETVKKFPAGTHYKVPHMGWNQVNFIANGVKALMPPSDFYFVHSYYVPVNQFTTGTCEYILPFSAMMKKDNFMAVQFHPEKSGPAGESILRYFLTQR